MADEYGPTTGTIRDVWVMGGAPYTSPRQRRTAFDRWLAAHDREVAAKALEEFAAECSAEYERITAEAGGYGQMKYRAALRNSEVLAVKRATAIREGRDDTAGWLRVHATKGREGATEEERR